MLRRKGAIALGTVVLALGLPLGAVSVQAESACKGLDSGACNKKGDCSWVDSYKRKDGVTVGAHCKAKPKKSGKSADKKKAESKKKSESKE